MERLEEGLLKEHIAGLQREAAATRLATAASGAGRRRIGRRVPRVAVRWVSSGLLLLATRLDPNITRPSYGRE